MPVRIGWQPGRGHWLLARRSMTTGEIAYHVCYGPRRIRLVDLVRIAGARWAIEECFQQAKNESGLDEYQVRDRRAWYAHITKTARRTRRAINSPTRTGLGLVSMAQTAPTPSPNLPLPAAWLPLSNR